VNFPGKFSPDGLSRFDNSDKDKNTKGHRINILILPAVCSRVPDPGPGPTIGVGLGPGSGPSVVIGFVHPFSLIFKNP